MSETPHEYIVRVLGTVEGISATEPGVSVDDDVISLGGGDAQSDARMVSVVYAEVGTDYDDALEGQIILSHNFRLDFRHKDIAVAEAMRKAAIDALRRGGRLAREGSRFDLYDAPTMLHRRVQEIAVEPL